MQKILLFLSVVFLSLTATAQPVIFTAGGKVIDAVTKLPLQAASVFAQNTTMGTATDAEGNFLLRLAAGGYDIIVTFTGYETFSKRVTSSDNNSNGIVIELKQKNKAMEEVVIKSSNEVKDGWEKYGSLFIENFIGKTSNSKLCTIKNKEALKFYFSKRRNRLKVLADAPVEIENLALGYKIKYTLDSFVHEFATTASAFTGYPLFEEIQTTDAAQQAAWQAKRLTAYNGSILHFMRSVYNKRLKEEGFEIQFVAKNNDKDTAIKLTNFYGALNYSKDDSTQVVDIVPNQPDVAVLYKNEEPEQEYFSGNDEAKRNFELSVISIAAAQSIAIEQNGYYYDQNDIITSGYWAWEKTADMVPYDFKIQ